MRREMRQETRQMEARGATFGATLEGAKRDAWQDICATVKPARVRRLIGGFTMKKRAIKTTPRPQRETPVKDSAKVEVFLPPTVWQRLRAKAKKAGKGGARYIAELAAQDVGKGGV